MVKKKRTIIQTEVSRGLLGQYKLFSYKESHTELHL